MLMRRTAERPKRILQTLPQRHETFAANNRMGMLEARKREPEMIEPVRKGRELSSRRCAGAIPGLTPTSAGRSNGACEAGAPRKGLSEM